jgi:hypothetical protein
VLACLFVASRLALLALGFRFEVGLATSALQDVRFALLRRHLLQSLWYLHGQPPLWNALLGLSLKAFPRRWPEAWHVVFLGLGLAELLALYLLALELRLPRRLALTLAAAFSLTPAVLLSESSLFYDYPTLVGVTATVLAAARFAGRPGIGRGLLLFGAAAVLVLSRTLFQVWWLLALVALVLVACRRHRREVLLACALPLALVVAVYVKNWVLFGVPSTTSWTGMGAARAAVEALPLAERRRLVAEGRLHAVSLVPPLAPLSAYERVGIRPEGRSGIALLDEATTEGSVPNLENRTYIRISRLYWEDDLWIVLHRPGAYLRAVRRGLADFFASPTLAWHGQGNEAKIGAYDRWFTLACYGTLGRGKVGLFLVGAFVLALAVGLAESARRLRPGASPATVAVSVATLTILYVTVVGNLAEVGENFRFRLVLDPLVLALCAFAGARAARAARRFLSMR